MCAIGDLLLYKYINNIIYQSQQKVRTEIITFSDSSKLTN